MTKFEITLEGNLAWIQCILPLQNGIGLTQVRQALQRHQGKLSIDSKVGEGITVTLNFPRADAPVWVAEVITLHRNDTVIVLDDDKSIHTAWDARFESVLNAAPDISLKHFMEGREVIRFVETLSDDEKKHMFLLTDYELLNQEVNGLDVIEKTEVSRKILVTSHYANEGIRQQAEKTGTKILPKELAPEIDILLDEAAEKAKPAKEKAVDLVILDDNQLFVNTLIDIVFTDLVVDSYDNSRAFLDAVSQYDKDTMLLLDYQLPDGLSGVEIAEKLHQNGYTKLYLLSGHNFNQSDLPNYLTAICKDNVPALEAIISKKT